MIHAEGLFEGGGVDGGRVVLPVADFFQFCFDGVDGGGDFFVGGLHQSAPVVAWSCSRQSLVRSRSRFPGRRWGQQGEGVALDVLLPVGLGLFDGVDGLLGEG